MFTAKLPLAALALLVTLVSANIQAQTASAAKYIPRERDWFSYDISTLMLQNQPTGYNEEGWSNGHTISFMKDMLIGKSKFSVAVGVAYISNNFKSNMRLSVDETTGNSSFVLLNGDSTSYNRNKVNAKYVEVPIELRYRSKPNKNGRYLRIYAGVKGGVRVSAYSLFENDQSQVRYYNPSEFNRWSAGTYLRIGFGAVSLYASYSLMPLFDYQAPENLPSNQVDANDLIPMGIGLSIHL